MSTTLDVSAFVDTSYSEDLDENLAIALLHPAAQGGSMSEAREEELLRVIRQEILPVLRRGVSRSWSTFAYGTGQARCSHPLTLLAIALSVK